MDLPELLERLPDTIWQALLRFLKVTEEDIRDLFDEAVVPWDGGEDETPT